MREYIMSIVGTALISSLVLMIAPEGKLSKYVRLTGAFCVLCATVSPLYSFLSGLSGFEKSSLPDIIFGEDIEDFDAQRTYLEGVYEENLMNAGADTIADALKGLICREMKLSADDVRIYVKMTEQDGEFIPAEVHILLSGKALFKDPRGIKDYVVSIFGEKCRCEIIYE
jgi:hypothetical protein